MITTIGGTTTMIEEHILETGDIGALKEEGGLLGMREENMKRAAEIHIIEGMIIIHHIIHLPSTDVTVQTSLPLHLKTLDLEPWNFRHLLKLLCR